MKNQIDPRRGVLYIAAGASHIRAALGSARSVRKTNPGLPIHLFADRQQQNVNLDSRTTPFTSFGNLASPHRRSKVEYVDQTPFQETLYLDTDTRVLCDLSDTFDLLGQFDIALAHAHKRELVREQDEQGSSRIPRAFPEFNSGVIFFKSNPETATVFRSWKQRFQGTESTRDQPSLREALWSSNLRIATLPPEYNVRFLKYLLMWSKDEAQPKILHLGFYRQGLMFYMDQWRRRLGRRFFLRSRAP